MKNFPKVLLICSFLMMTVTNVFSDTEIKQPVTVSKKLESLKMKDAVLLALKNNPLLKNAVLEVVKSDSTEKKNESRYALRFLAGIESSKNVLPFNMLNFFSGTKVHNDKLSAGLEKMISTGTYFKFEGSTTRFDSNAFEDPASTPAQFQALGIPPLYTGAIQLTLAQDLLKNAFGYQEKNILEILKNQTAMQKDENAFKLSGLVVQSLVDYWSFTVNDAAFTTYKKLRDNALNIRDLTKRKQAIGLAENFEINQWNALFNQAESQMEKSKIERDEVRRKLLRSLGLDPDTEIVGQPELMEELPEKINYKLDLEYALKNRVDIKNAHRRKFISELNLKNAKNEALPSLKLSGYYASKGQTLISPSDNFSNNRDGVFSFKYEEKVGQLKMVYSISDPGIKAGIRDAEIQLRQATLLEEDSRKEVRDDVQSKMEAVLAGYKILENAKKTEKEAEKYYYGLLSSFRKGRFTAVAVKNALDTLVQYQLALAQARVNYNISVLRYDLAKNSLFDKFGISVEQVIPSLN